MVDSGWGWLSGPNVIWICHRLAFGAGGLTTCSDARSAPVERYARGIPLCNFLSSRAISMRKETNSGTPHMPLRAAICFFSHSYRPGAQEVAQGCVRAFVNPTADDLKIGPRRDRKLGDPSDDLPILCWDLEALPTHHLPWAGFGLGQPHWPMVDARFY